MDIGRIVGLIKALGSGGGDPSGGGVLAVHDVNGTLDKTWQEIADAVATTGAAVVYGSGDHVSGASTVINCGENLLSEKFFVNAGRIDTYEASSASGYPTYADE